MIRIRNSIEYAYLIELSELPLTTRRSRYWRQAIPRLWPLRVRTNSHVDVDHTLIVRSPLADTIYFSSKSTTFTAARCPTNTRRRVISLGEVMSQTAIDRSFEQVTIIPLLKRKWRTASQWCIKVLTISPVFTSQTRTVESLEPLMMTLSSYWRQSTEPVWPVRVWRNLLVTFFSCLYIQSNTNLNALEIRSVPDFNCIISKTWYDFDIVVLKTIDTFWVFWTAVDST